MRHRRRHHRRHSLKKRYSKTVHVKGYLRRKPR